MIVILAIYAGILSVAMAIYNYRINKNALFISNIILIFASYSVTHYLCLYSTNPFLIAIFLGHFTPYWYLIGPSVYLYTRNTLNDETRIKKSDIWHLIPMLVHFINMVPYYIKPFELKYQYAESLIQNIDNIKFYGGGFIYSTTFAHIERGLLGIGYTLVSGFSLIRYYKSKIVGKQNNLVFIWLIVMHVIILVTMSSYFSQTLLLLSHKLTIPKIESTLSHVIAWVSFFILPTSLLLFFPQILYGMPIANYIKPKKSSKNQSKISSDPLVDTTNMILNYIQEKKPFLNPDFDVIDISNELEIPKHHIIYCFSEIIKIKFTAYRSLLRVEYAKKLLESGKANSYSMDGIGQQAGFPSRSTFYATFKAETGMTPNQYLENLGNN
ncbi:AraC family transcriptional regulator [Sandaracinomonas limnophila]|uniref:AraC family transcriptional regulator n=1 Tax=Sandaracinomonas limnophila TaxID=1862386 RepID=A0A437PXC7_9BACT|nr:AraC family transcriptional regulator [Sandaracinomonas limnophila]RVU26899.1 AraC family transcriptional regulator [Sandaracinomonas limnophila]